MYNEKWQLGTNFAFFVFLHAVAEWHYECTAGQMLLLWNPCHLFTVPKYPFLSSGFTWSSYLLPDSNMYCIKEVMLGCHLQAHPIAIKLIHLVCLKNRPTHPCSYLNRLFPKTNGPSVNKSNVQNSAICLSYAAAFLFASEILGEISPFLCAGIFSFKYQADRSSHWAARCNQTKPKSFLIQLYSRIQLTN